MLLEQEENEMKHKHAELIKAWADGAEIQVNDDDVWCEVIQPDWNENLNYRIKPAEKVVRWLWARKDMHGTWIPTSCYLTEDEFRHATPEGREYKKLEWSREEFDE
jgi:hypothetical protein